MLELRSSHQLVEFLLAVSVHEEQREATAAAAELAAEQFNAEIGAIIIGNEVRAAVGFGSDVVPAEQLCRAHPGQRTIQLPREGACELAVASWAGGEEGRVVVIRLEAPFSPDERNLLMGMARVLGLSLRQIASLQTERLLRTEREREADERLVLLSSLRERQRLLEVLLEIQHSISHREPLREVLGKVTAGASALLGSDCAVSLVLNDGFDPERPIIAATTRHAARCHDPAGVIVAARTVRSREAPIAGTLTAPVHVSGKAAGALVAMSGAGESFDQSQSRMLDAFAEHASLALTDARTVEAMQEAFHDPLTSLPNRALFLERLEHALDGGTAHPNALAVLFVDLDRFKLVNDTFGHGAGDDLLIQVADRLRERIRSCDFAGRLGGDEFAVIVADVTSAELPAAIAKRILDALASAFTVAGHDVFIDASIGIALGTPRLDDAEGLIRDADLAMYKAKQNGRGRYELFHEDMAAPLRNRVKLDADLHRAIDHDELLLHYQPIVRLTDGELVGGEALLRWHHPDRGLIPPLQFIPLAEETGLIVPIGRWILAEACQQAARWQTARPSRKPLFVSVNLSARQLQDGRLLRDVVAALNDCGLPPELLKLEITETSLLHDSKAAVTMLDRLREHGVRIAMDDFGTGYSSLTNLRRLPIDILKIDRSFVAEIGTDAKAAAFAYSIVSLARPLGLLTVAEGIESDGQLKTMLNAGCDLGQGYHFAPPHDPDTFLELMTTTTPVPVKFAICSAT